MSDTTLYIIAAILIPLMFGVVLFYDPKYIRDFLKKLKGKA